jgi:hypothetical protein
MKNAAKFFYGMEDRLNQLVTAGEITQETKIRSMATLSYYAVPKNPKKQE